MPETPVFTAAAVIGAVGGYLGLQTMRPAPWSLQPATAPRPTMPAPKTTHVDPDSTFAVFIASPSSR